MATFKDVFKSYLDTIHQTIDISAAVLLLTGQITIRSVNLSSGAYFRLSLTGPIFGGQRSEARPENGPGAALTLDAVDVIVAFLLILGQVQIVGMFIQSQRFNLLVGGPPFGEPGIEGYVPEAAGFFQDYRDHLLNRYMTDSPQRGTKRRD